MSYELGIKEMLSSNVSGTKNGVTVMSSAYYADEDVRRSVDTLTEYHRNAIFSVTVENTGAYFRKQYSVYRDSGQERTLMLETMLQHALGIAIGASKVSLVRLKQLDPVHTEDIDKALVKFRKLCDPVHGASADATEDAPYKGAQYAPFQKKKRSGGIRIIHAPTPFTSDMQQRIKTLAYVLKPADESFSPDNLAYVPGRNFVESLKEMKLKQKRMLSIDMRNYYHQINGTKLSETLMFLVNNNYKNSDTVVADSLHIADKLIAMLADIPSIPKSTGKELLNHAHRVANIRRALGLKGNMYGSPEKDTSGIIMEESDARQVIAYNEGMATVEVNALRFIAVILETIGTDKDAIKLNMFKPLFRYINDRSKNFARLVRNEFSSYDRYYNPTITSSRVESEGEVSFTRATNTRLMNKTTRELDGKSNSYDNINNKVVPDEKFWKFITATYGEGAMEGLTSDRVHVVSTILPLYLYLMRAAVSTRLVMNYESISSVALDREEALSVVPLLLLYIGDGTDPGKHVDNLRKKIETATPEGAAYRIGLSRLFREVGNELGVNRALTVPDMLALINFNGKIEKGIDSSVISDNSQLKYAYGLPQGAPTSSFLANAMSEVLLNAISDKDASLQERGKKLAYKDLRVLVYSDNLYLWYNADSDKGDAQVSSLAHSVITSLGLAVNAKKTHLETGKDKKLLGVIVDSEGRVRVSRAQIYELNQIIINLTKSETGSIEYKGYPYSSKDMRRLVGLRNWAVDSVGREGYKQTIFKVKTKRSGKRLKATKEAI